MMSFVSSSERDTHRIAAALATACFEAITKGLKQGSTGDQTAILISLQGTLGAGKTEFCRGFVQKWMELQNLPFDGTVTSPTYSLMKLYGPGSAELSKQHLAHMDLYRLSSPEELEEIGLAHVVSKAGVALIEWFDLFESQNGGDNLSQQLPSPLVVELYGDTPGHPQFLPTKRTIDLDAPKSLSSLEKRVKAILQSQSQS